MDREEKITKLCEKVMVTREEAEAALAANDDDILDAVLYLEALGRIRNPKAAQYAEESYEEPVKKQCKKEKHKSESFGELLGRFCRWCVKMIKAGCENYLDIEKEGETVVKIPLIIPAILLIPCFWLIAILMIIGLFCGLHYSFSGPAFSKDNRFNEAAGKASDRTQKFKNDFNRGYYMDDQE